MDINEFFKEVEDKLPEGYPELPDDEWMKAPLGTPTQRDEPDAPEPDELPCEPVKTDLF